MATHETLMTDPENGKMVSITPTRRRGVRLGRGRFWRLLLEGRAVAVVDEAFFFYQRWCLQVPLPCRRTTGGIGVGVSRAWS